MKDLEELLKQAKNEKKEIPHFITNRIQNCFSEKTRESRRNFYMKKKVKLVAAFSACIIVLTGAVFAKDITNFVKNLFGPNSSQGVDTAVENGYVEQVKTEFQEAEGIEIKIKDMLMDDFNFAMNFEVKLAEQYNIDEFEHTQIQDLKITDENENIIFASKEENDKEKKAFNGGYSFLAQMIDNHNFSLSLSSPSANNIYPKSKKLKIHFQSLTTWNYENEEKIEKKYTGDWNFEIEVPKEFYERESITYQVKSCNDSKTTVTKASLSNTALKIALTTTSDKIDYEALHKGYDGTSIYRAIALSREYVENAKGKRFETAQRSDGDGGYNLLDNNRVEYYQTFNLTSYDATDNLEVHLKTNTDQEIVIELEKQK